MPCPLRRMGQTPVTSQFQVATKNFLTKIPNNYTWPDLEFESNPSGLHTSRENQFQQVFTAPCFRANVYAAIVAFDCIWSDR